MSKTSKCHTILKPSTDQCSFCCYNVTIKFTAKFIRFDVNFVKHCIVWCLSVFLTVNMLRISGRFAVRFVRVMCNYMKEM